MSSLFRMFTGIPLQAVLMVDRMISPFTLTAGPVLFILSLSLIKDDKSFVNVVTTLCVYFIWVLVSRTVRMLPHFYRCPGECRLPSAALLSATVLVAPHSAPNVAPYTRLHFMSMPRL